MAWMVFGLDKIDISGCWLECLEPRSTIMKIYNTSQVTYLLHK